MRILVTMMCQSIKKCPVPLTLGSLFTAVSASIVSEIFPWGDQCAVLSPWICAARDTFQDVRGAVSVKEYSGHYHFSDTARMQNSPFLLSLDPCWGWAPLSHSEKLTCIHLMGPNFHSIFHKMALQMSSWHFHLQKRNMLKSLRGKSEWFEKNSPQLSDVPIKAV